MNQVQLDAIVEPVLEELGKQLEWKSRSELAFRKDSAWIGTYLSDRLAKVPDTHREPIVRRLASFGHYLEREQRSFEASRVFMTGLQSAVGEVPAAPHLRPAAAESAPSTKKWTFKTGRGPMRKSSMRPYRRIKTRV
jgi:hypothetical protein